jgi:hypothetical protein
MYLKSISFLLALLTPVAAFATGTGSRRHTSQRELTALSVTYDYQAAIAQPAADQATIVLNVDQSRIPETFAVQVYLEDLSQPSANRDLVLPLTATDGKAQITLEGLHPNRAYRAFVNVYRAAHTDESEALGYVPFPYYFATTADDEESLKRFRVVMNAVHHYYRARRGTDRNMDCWAFTRRYAGAEFTNWNRRNHYGQDIPQLAQTGSILGDYVRIPDYHSLLLLAYDAENDKVWSVEGNFNSTIEIGVRSSYRSWWLTHQTTF